MKTGQVYLATVMMVVSVLLVSTRSLAIGFFGYSVQGKKFMALCSAFTSHSSPPSFNRDSRLIINTMLRFAATNDCNLAWEKLKKVRFFDFSNRGLRDISALSVLKHATSIDLRNNYLTDLSPLNFVEGLTTIRVDNNCLKEFGQFRPGIALTLLSVANNELIESAFRYLKSFRLPLRVERGGQAEMQLRCHAHGMQPNLVIRPSTRVAVVNPVPLQIQVPVQTQVAITKPEPPESTTVPAISLSPKNVAAQVEDRLKAIKKLGITFSSVIMMEAVTNYSQLKSALEEMGIIKINDEEILQYLYQVSGLLDELKESHHLAVQHGKNGQQASWQINHQTLSKEITARSFGQRIEELRFKRAFNDDFYRNFYRRLMRKPTLLSNANYPDGERGDSLLKASDLILLLAAIKQENTGTTTQRYLARDMVAAYGEQYNSSGQSSEWYQELRFKLFKLYLRYPSLNDEQKTMLISYFLHGGAHCNDAKWHAINDAFNRFCPDDAKTLAEEYGKANGRPDLEAMVKAAIARLKVEKLTTYINEYIERTRRTQEYCSTFNATWDAVAPRLGLAPVGSRYNLAITEAVNGFDHFYQNFTPPMLAKAIGGDIKEFLKKRYFGPLMQLTSEGDGLVMDILHYFEFIY